MRRLAVIGDDFGVSREVNAGIAEGYDRGILTGASLMVTGAHAGEAMAIARERPGLAVGLHLVLVDGKAASPPDGIPHLADSEGRFLGDPTRAGLRYWFSRTARRELTVEIRAQLELFRRTRLKIAHLDGHHHLHLHPVVLDVLTRDDALPLPIPSVRVPAEELSLAFELDPGHAAGQTASAAVFSLLRRHAARRLRDAGIAFPERVYGLLGTGRITERYLARLIPRITANRAEIYCHPSTASGSRRGASAGAQELRALTSARVRAAVSAAGFVLERANVRPIATAGRA